MEVVQSPLLNSVKVEEKEQVSDDIMTITDINIRKSITSICLMKLILLQGTE